jgi:hypothetical protein
MTPEQQAAVAAFMAQQQAGAAPALQGNGLAAQLRSAPDPTKSGQSFSDDGGKYDGEYTVTIEEVGIKNVSKGQVFSASLRVEETSNPAIRVGEVREHPMFLWSPAAVSECKGFVQMLSDALTGSSAPFSDAFLSGLTGEQQLGKGTRLSLRVFTAQQKRDKSKTFTHTRFSVLDATCAGLDSPRPEPAAATSQIGGYTPAPALGTEPPPGWPPSIPWPGAAA